MQHTGFGPNKIRTSNGKYWPTTLDWQNRNGSNRTVDQNRTEWHRSSLRRATYPPAAHRGEISRERCTCTRAACRQPADEQGLIGPMGRTNLKYRDQRRGGSAGRRRGSARARGGASRRPPRLRSKWSARKGDSANPGGGRGSGAGTARVAHSVGDVDDLGAGVLDAYDVVAESMHGMLDCDDAGAMFPGEWLRVVRVSSVVCGDVARVIFHCGARSAGMP